MADAEVNVKQRIAAVNSIELEIKDLRINYEQYFAGIERLEPLERRRKLKRLIRTTRPIVSGNTALNFRLNQAQATLNSYETYWNRIARQIEEGTFKRDKIRAAKKQASIAEAAKSTAKIDSATKNMTAQGRAGPKSAAGESHSRVGGVTGNDTALSQLHSAYTKACRSVGANANISEKAIASTIAKQKAAILAKYKCKDVDFKVAVKAGKVIIKASPIK